MKKYIISLVNSPYRKKSWPINDYHFFDAVSRESTEQFTFSREISNVIYGRELTQGEVGCALSHYTVINEFSNSDEEFALILEDDALIEGGFSDCVRSIEKRQTEEPVIYLLGYAKTCKKHKSIRKIKYPLSSKVDIDGFIFGQSELNQCGAVAYIINKAAARIISDIKHLFWVADEWKIVKNLGISIYYPQTPVVYEDLVTPSSTGNIVHSTESLSKFPLKNIYMIVKNQTKHLLRKQK